MSQDTFLSNVQDLKDIYRAIKPRIEARFREFESLWKEGSDERLFVELAFCLLTPQSKARVCWRIVEDLWTKDLLFTADTHTLSEAMRRVRFRHKKARNILAAREMFGPRGTGLRQWLSEFSMTYTMREGLVRDVRGMGYKEASHFLRNIGIGNDIAILDRHILRCLVRYRVIDAIPKTITAKKYLEIEGRMRAFAFDTGIPMEHLDLLLWYIATGDIFK